MNCEFHSAKIGKEAPVNVGIEYGMIYHVRTEQKHNSVQEPPINRRSSPALGLHNQFYHYIKPSLGKSSNRSYNNGVRITPVLNIAPNSTVSLFGMGSLFSSKKIEEEEIMILTIYFYFILLNIVQIESFPFEISIFLVIECCKQKLKVN